MTPLSALTPQSRPSGLAGATSLAIFVESTPQSVQRAQPVEKIHAPAFRATRQQAHHGRNRQAQQTLKLLPEAESRRAPRRSIEHLSPVAKFGDSAPAMTQLIAHEGGYLRAYMPNEMSAFSRDLPAHAYQATLDRSRSFMMDHPPLHVAA